MARTGLPAAALGLLVALACRDRNPAYRVAGADAAEPATGADARDVSRVMPDLRSDDRAPSPPEGGAREAAPEVAVRPTEAGAPDTPAGREYHWIECEAGQLSGAMARADDPAAFGGAYVHVPVGPPDWFWNAGNPALPPDRVELPVTLGAGGTYVVWVRFWAVAGESDAWYAGFDRTDLRRFYYNVAYRRWVWTRHTERGDGLQFDGLAPGRRTLVLGRAEAGPRCDRVLVTNDLQYVPQVVP